MSKKQKIIIVDDDLLYQESIYHHLKNELKTPVQIEKYSTGEELLKSIQFQPDFIILDYYLNSRIADAMNGVSVLKKINEASPLSIVIMLSANDNIEVALNTISHGAYDYVVKNESAYLRITNIIKNIQKRDNLHEKLKRQLKIYKTINIIVILLLGALFILSRILTDGKTSP
jgi:two-component system, OmpR family, response regulator